MLLSKIMMMVVVVVVVVGGIGGVGGGDGGGDDDNANNIQINSACSPNVTPPTARFAPADVSCTFTKFFTSMISVTAPR